MAAVAGQFYDNLLGERGSLRYTWDYTPEISYPEQDQINIFGPIYVPRIYGKDLDTLEIASSGSISLSVQDVHSLDINRDNATSNVTLSTLCNDSFMLSANTGAMYMSMDSASNVMTVSSANVVDISAGDRFKAMTGEGADSNTYLLLDDIAYTATLFAKSNVDLIAGASVNVTAGDSINWGTSADFVISASNDIILRASNDVEIVGAVDVNISASNNAVIQAAGASATFANYAATITASSNMNLTSLENVIINSGLTTTVTSCNDVLVTSGQNTVISAAGTSASFANYAATITASSNLTLITENDMTLSSGQTTTITSSNDVLVTSLENVTITSGSATTVTSSNNVTITSEQNVLVSSLQNTTVTSSNNVVVTSAGNVTVTSGDTTTITSSSNVLLTAGTDARITATGQLVMGTSNNFVRAVFDPAGVYTVVAGAESNSYMIFDNDYTITTHSTDDIRITTCNDLTFSAQSNFTLSADQLTMTGGTQAQITAGTSYFNMNSDSTVTANAASYDFSVAGNIVSPIMSVLSDKVVIRGNLELLGTLDTINTTVTDLFVQDKVIQMATASNGVQVLDGILTNDQAGVAIAGLPANLPSASNWTYPKSMLWNYGAGAYAGVKGLGTSNIEDESFWELRGGGLRITHTKVGAVDGNGNVATEEVSFGFRVNDRDELELVKKLWNGSAYIYKRVAKFGKTLNL